MVSEYRSKVAGRMKSVNRLRPGRALKTQGLCAVSAHIKRQACHAAQQSTVACTGSAETRVRSALGPWRKTMKDPNVCARVVLLEPNIHVRWVDGHMQHTKDTDTTEHYCTKKS